MSAIDELFDELFLSSPLPPPDTTVIGLNTTTAGDCLNLLPRIKPNSINLVLCDLPYGVTRNSWDCSIPLDRLWQEYERVLAPNGVVCLTAVQPFTTALISSKLKWFKYCWVWHKSKPTGFLNAKIQPLRNTEDVVIFCKTTGIYNPQGTTPTNKLVHRTNRGNYGDCSQSTVQTVTGYPTTLIQFNTETGLHPTQKPVSLFEYLVLTYTNPGDTVLDNCCGSGTTGVACKKTLRNFIQFDISEEFCEIARNRLAGVRA